MKRFLIIVLCFTLMSTSVYAQSEASFPDVPPGSQYYTAVEHFSAEGVIQGYEDGTFKPDQEANRAEALKIILLSSGIEGDAATGFTLFPDVAEDDWHYPYVQRGYNSNIIEGYEDGMFKPSQTLNLAETLKIILLTHGITVSAVEENTTVFPDVTSDLWFAPYAAYAKEKNIIEPENDGGMHAGQGVTRGELVELMYRMEIVLQNNGEPFDISTNWPIEKYPEYAFQSKRPFTWTVVNNEDEVVFWRPDTVNHQSSYEIPFPFSASMTFHLDHNEDGLSPAEYEQNLEMVYKSDFGSYQKNSLNLAGHSAVEFNVSPVHDDYFIFIPDNKVLQIYTSYGWSDLTDQLRKEIDEILVSVSYISPQDVSSQDILSEARNRILVEGMGQQTLDLFSDLTNIETDTIGVGTGPVDYFYSSEYNVTLKYERSTDTILDIQDGETSAF